MLPIEKVRNQVNFASDTLNKAEAEAEFNDYYHVLCTDM